VSTGEREIKVERQVYRGKLSVQDYTTFIWVESSFNAVDLAYQNALDGIRNYLNVLRDSFPDDTTLRQMCYSIDMEAYAARLSLDGLATFILAIKNRWL
jgi:hypothetical protein